MKLFVVLALPFAVLAGSAAADQDLHSIRVTSPPKLNCMADDAAWTQAPVVVTKDAKAGINIELRTVHTDKEIFFLVKFPDPTESRKHKHLRWNDRLKAYRTGPSREDSFVIKWSMAVQPVDLSITGDTPYKADVWYWKAGRTDPVGYADDKYHLYGPIKAPNSKALYNRSGQVMYLTRNADDGKSAYKSQSYTRLAQPEMPRYTNREPQGSRADVRAKGCWKNGQWTIEFFRKLKTGHVDDVQFEPGRPYRFGISRFEIAGKPANKKIDQPLYESGDIGEHLTLRWK